MGQTHHTRPVLTRKSLENIKEGTRKQDLPDSITNMVVHFVSGEIQTIYVDSTITCKQLKALLFHKINKILEPQDMILKLNDNIIKNHEVIGQLLNVADILIQQKRPLDDLSGIQYFGDYQDDFTLEKGVVKMPCGHKIGRDAIIYFLENTVTERQCQIICPHEGCKAEWTYSLCKKVGCFTRSQHKKYSEGLNLNWLNKHSKICPGCKNAIVFDSNQKISKVICSNKKCKFGVFCFICLKKWRGSSDDDCGNVSCSFTKTFWQGVGTKKFTLMSQNNARRITIDVPTHRLCPNCKSSIEHNEGCKHMKCVFCKTEFCFVCLSVREKLWKCGSFNSYCGQVAEKQKLI